MTQNAARKKIALWPDYRTVYRWHFFAGLFCLPFVALLSLTGTIYLFKPQIDSWIDWRYDHLAIVADPAKPSAAVRAALSAVPGGRFLAYELPHSGSAAARVLVDRQGDAIRVYVDRSSLAILKQVPEEHRFERLVFKLHGQLLLGNVGSIIMEMVASWTIVLIVTGCYLWWPRNISGRLSLAGIFYPRLSAGGRAAWRDFHAVTGVWVSLFLAIFLVSGLPWSFVWGHALQSVQREVGRLTSVQSWEIGAVPARDVVAGREVASSGGTTSMPGMDMGPQVSIHADDLAGLDVAARTAMTLDLPAPVLVTPPSMPGEPWRVRSDTQDRPLRVSLLVDGSGRVVSRESFADKGVVDRVVGYGVAAHEGHLFGWANQLLNLLVASGLFLMSIAATVLWIRRKPPGELGAPRALPSGRVGGGAVVVMILLGMVLPELGASLLCLLVAAWLMPQRAKA